MCYVINSNNNNGNDNSNSFRNQLKQMNVFDVYNPHMWREQLHHFARTFMFRNVTVKITSLLIRYPLEINTYMDVKR